jgi:energy-coupling factor transport system permease protein
MNIKMLSYTPNDTWIHRLSGASKLVFFILWTIAVMITYDTRCLALMFIFSIVVFLISRVKFSEVSFVLYFILFFFVMNQIAIFLFSPLEGVAIYGTRHDWFHLFWRYTVTAEQMFYQLNVMLKYITVIPLALLFMKTTSPSEFAASLNRIGVNYKIAYAVSITMRYIPDVMTDYQDISFAQQARGIDMSRKEKLLKRLKNVSAILWPLIFSSLERIETISAAMELRGFGQKSYRTWYRARPFARRDYIALVMIILITVVTSIITFYDGQRFYNPFIS